MSKRGAVSDYPHAEINLGSDSGQEREFLDDVVDVLAERPVVTAAVLVGVAALSAGVLTALARRSRSRSAVRDVRIARNLQRQSDPLF
jgi:hypothetical protein